MSEVEISAYSGEIVHRFRLMSAIDSDHYSISGRHRPESLADLLRIRWPTWLGITGRLWSDYA